MSIAHGGESRRDRSILWLDCEYWCMGYEEKVTMGCSIGCANSFVPGSLGGWVKDIATQEKLAITAGHGN